VKSRRCRHRAVNSSKNAIICPAAEKIGESFITGKKMSGLFEELKRRNVFKVGTAYVVLAWLLAQFTDVFLEPFGAPDWVIKTILLVLLGGFPLALFFAWAFEMTPEGIKKEKDIDRTQSITSETGQKLNLAIILTLLLALGYFSVDKFYLASLREAEKAEIAEENQTPGVEVAPKEKSIAVLPFVNMSDDSSNEYFSDGIAEEILNSLARVKELKVAGRTSSFAFKGQNQDLRQIGEALGVEHILEGSVRKSGTKVRITAQLIQVDDGFHLWSDTYDRELDDVFAIQDEIATAILEQLKAHLLDGEQIIISTAQANPESYDLYLLAKQRMYERSRPTLESAATLLDKAIGIDPDYAPAYAQRGITALLLVDNQYGILSLEESQSQGKLYLDQASRLDPQLAEALAGLGLYYTNIPGKSDESIDYLERALAINPNLIDASNWLQAAYAGSGRLAESIQILEAMAEKDPLYRPGFANLNRVYVAQTELDKARAMVERVRPFMPNDPFLLRIEANIHYATGNPARGLVLMEEALAQQPDNGPNIGLRGFGLLITSQFERLAEQGMPWQRIIALQQLDRMEEATILAWEQANSGEDVNSLIGLLTNSGKVDEMIRFFEDRWENLDAYVEEYPPLGNGSVGSLMDIAYAYGSLGNQAVFDDAMKRTEMALVQLSALGYKNPFMTFNRAVYFTMAGDREQAHTFLNEAVDGGFLVGTRFYDGWAAMKVMDGDPQFEAIQARMVEHLNRERAELGLEPVS
jgi:TolB-like protein